MKKIFFPAMAAMALGLASCSSDEPTSNGGGIDLSKGGYVKLSINLPTAKSSRATNDNFNDGMAKEYSVKNAQLILFTGTSESDATFHSAYNLATSMEMENPVNNQITSTTKIVEKTTNKGETGKSLYALVILNNNGETEVTDGYGLKVGETTLTTSTKFTDFAQSLSTTNNATPKFASEVATKGIFMTNAPLASNAGGATDPNSSSAATIATLTDVTHYVFDTEAQAQNSPAANVYVERGVAKVTFSKTSSGSKFDGTKTNDGTGELTGEEFKTNKVTYEILGWNLDVTNKKSYLVRQASTDWNSLISNYSTGDKYRFIGGTAVNTNLYRTYWAIDPNYEGFIAGDFYTQQNTSPTLSADFGDTNPQYCYENTFNVDNMNQNQTTRAVVSVRLSIDAANPNQDLYIFNGDRSKLYSKTDCYTRITTAVAHALEGTDDEGKTVASDNDITLVKTGSADGCTYKVQSIKAGNHNLTTSELEYVNNEVKNITIYEKGIAYYPIRIKHFGDDSTPWNKEGQGVTSTAVYPTTNQNDNFLGRYGVLRNNWYDIAVTKIAGVGTPSIPETDDTPDDELSSYISVRINILSWAKRQQNAEL